MHMYSVLTLIPRHSSLTFFVVVFLSCCCVCDLFLMLHTSCCAHLHSVLDIHELQWHSHVAIRANPSYMIIQREALPHPTPLPQDPGAPLSGLLVAMFRESVYTSYMHIYNDNDIVVHTYTCYYNAKPYPPPFGLIYLAV